MSKIKRVPELRFGEFSGEWEEKKLCDTSKIVGGGTPETIKAEYWDGNIQWFTPTEIKSKFIINSKRTITELGLQKSSAKLLPKGTLLLSSRATVGDVGIALEECTTNQGFQSLVVNHKNEIEFLYNWIIKNKNEFLKRASGSTFLEINKTEIEKIKINLPLKAEQEKIASFLSGVDERIEQLGKKQKLLEQYKKGVMQKIFSQEIRFKDDDGSDYPEWVGKNGNELFDSISNKNHNSDLPILAISQEFGAVPRELINYQISVTDKSIDGYKIVEIGDFIISLRSFQGGIEYSNYKGICSPAYIILRSKVKIDNTFFKYYFKTDFYIQKLGEKLEGIRDGKMISYKYFSEIELPFPSLTEQTKIANFLSSLDSKLSHVEQQLNSTKQFKKALLQKMFV